LPNFSWYNFKHFPRWTCVLVGTLCLIFLQSCTSVSDGALETAKSAFTNTSKLIEQTSLNYQLSYLRVNVSGLDALLVKGYIDKDSNGSIDVWYASDGSILRLQEGRYLGSIGFDNNWQNVSYQNTPNFNKIVAEFDRPNPSPKLSSVSDFYPSEQYYFSRSHSEMPSYKTVINEKFSASVSKDVPSNIPKSMKSYLSGKNLIWVTEQNSQSSSEKLSNVQSWYGFEKSSNQYELVIGQQCLTTSFCITWMPWPIQ
jgi:hypothetical protein